MQRLTEQTHNGFFAKDQLGLQSGQPRHNFTESLQSVAAASTATITL